MLFSGFKVINEVTVSVRQRVCKAKDGAVDFFLIQWLFCLFLRCWKLCDRPSRTTIANRTLGAFRNEFKLLTKQIRYLIISLLNEVLLGRELNAEPELVKFVSFFRATFNLPSNFALSELLDNRVLACDPISAFSAVQGLNPCQDLHATVIEV